MNQGMEPLPVTLPLPKLASSKSRREKAGCTSCIIIHSKKLINRQNRHVEVDLSCIAHL